jgi:hypothetical protein
MRMLSDVVVVSPRCENSRRLRPRARDYSLARPSAREYYEPFIVSRRAGTCSPASVALTVSGHLAERYIQQNILRDRDYSVERSACSSHDLATRQQSRARLGQADRLHTSWQRFPRDDGTHTTHRPIEWFADVDRRVNEPNGA